MVLLIKKIFCLGVIAVFPLFMTALMTFRFQDPIPLRCNWWLGAALIWSAFFYAMISPLFYRKYPFFFRCFVWVGILSFLMGSVAFWYYYSFVLADETLLYSWF